LARVEDWDGNLLTQAACTGISYKIIDRDNNNAVTASGSLTVATVVFDAAQTGGNWPYSDGYNFKAMIAATAFPTGGHRYVAEVIVDPVSGEDFPLRWILQAYNLVGS
jgi:hypothetical protein